MKNKIDIKIIFILILAIALILSFVFRPSKVIDVHKDSFNKLKLDNIKLKNNNDSIKLVNKEISKEIEELIISIDSTNKVLVNTENRLNDLENEDGKVSDYVRGLDADGVAESITEYLNRR